MASTARTASTDVFEGRRVPDFIELTAEKQMLTVRAGRTWQPAEGQGS
jgi:hypothetical protein